LRLALLVSACVASGTLECSSHSGFSPAQRRGERLYTQMCAVCHGRTGDGYAADRAPAIAHRDFLASASDEYLRAAIANGRASTTMSAWATSHGGPLAPAEIDAVVAFLRTWGSAQPGVLDERPKTGDAGRGAEIFGRECTRCHGKDGTGGPEVHVGAADLLASASDGFLRYAIHRGRNGTPMPAFGAALGDGAVEDVVAVLRSWQGRPVPTPRAAVAKPPPLPLGPVPLNPHGPEPQGFVAQGTGTGTTRVDTVKAQLDRGAKLALLDARAPSDYMREHIGGAVSVPFYDPDPYLSQLPRDAWLVAYCACPHAESGQLAQKLLAHGFTKVTVLDEGLGVWRARKYPTQTGVDP
jgi:cytochrome c oxidase cbb3-type subunit 3/ubiquinol-cytochrome c reductase cytochrome c subunit